MNRRWVIPLLVAVGAAALAFGLVRWSGCPCEGTARDRMADLSVLTRELGLSGEQAAAIGELRAAFAGTLEGCCERHCEARMRLGRALAESPDDPARAEALVDEMCRAYEESERATLAHVRRVREVLNEEQRVRFDRMMAESVCRNCPVCDSAEARRHAHNQKREGEQR